jgi:hypothetical protein
MTNSKLLLLCGSGHNGSTILARILLAHYAIGGALSETFVFGLTPQQAWPGVFEQLELQSNSPQWVLEKTPLHLFNAARILEIFSSASCLFLIRDGRDVVASMVRRSLTLDSAMQRWSSSAKEILLLRSLFPSRTFLVRYEDLVACPKNTLSNISRFLGLKSAPLIHAAQSSADITYLGHQIDARSAITFYGTHENVHHDISHDLRRATQAALPLSKSVMSRWAELDPDQRKAVMNNDDFLLYEKIYGYLPWSFRPEMH